MKNRDLTGGNVTKSLLYFAGPMILGNLLQQCYNIADIWVVRKYVGARALAAVKQIGVLGIWGGTIPSAGLWRMWLTFGNHMYRRDGERCNVEFIDNHLGIRKTIVDNNGNIIGFPGIEKGEWMEFIKYEKYDDKLYIMIWEV